MNPLRELIANSLTDYFLQKLKKIDSNFKDFKLEINWQKKRLSLRTASFNYKLIHFTSDLILH